MKAITFLGLMTFLCLSSAAGAAESRALDLSDIDVVAVSPRSAGDRPYVMTVFPKKPPEQMAANLHRKSADAVLSKSARQE